MSSDSDLSEEVHGAQCNSTVAFVLPLEVTGKRLSYALPALLHSPAHITLTGHIPVSGVAPSIGKLIQRHATRPHRRNKHPQRTFIAKAEPSNLWGEKVLVKYAIDKAIDDLVHEARFYLTQLRPLWDVAVPRCLGFFRARDHGHEVACLVLELCTGLPHSGSHAFDYRELTRLMMQAIAKVHVAGVMHGALLPAIGASMADNLRHFVVKTDEHGRPKVFVVDFVSAKMHACYDTPPAVLYGGEGLMEGCAELAAMEENFGMLLDRDEKASLVNGMPPTPWD